MCAKNCKPRNTAVPSATMLDGQGLSPSFLLWTWCTCVAAMTVQMPVPLKSHDPDRPQWLPWLRGHGQRMKGTGQWRQAQEEALLGTPHMPAHHSLVSAEAQSLSLLRVQTSKDQRLRNPCGIQACALCCTFPVPEAGQGLNGDHIVQPHSKD